MQMWALIVIRYVSRESGHICAFSISHDYCTDDDYVMPHTGTNTPQWHHIIIIGAVVMRNDYVMPHTGTNTPQWPVPVLPRPDTHSLWE